MIFAYTQFHRLSQRANQFNIRDELEQEREKYTHRQTFENKPNTKTESVSFDVNESKTDLIEMPITIIGF